MSELVDLLGRLVAIDSVNPDLVPGAAGEREIAAFVAGWLERAGLDVTVSEVAPGRPNVIAVAKGRGGGRALMLNAHTDTVGVGGMESPLEPRVEGGRLHGRGAFDMKGSLAATMLAAASLARLAPRGDVIVTAVVDEEYASAGTDAVARKLSADAAIVTEPTGLDVCIAHKGFLWLDVETAGRAAHGSRPDLGVDAIVKMGPVLTGLGALDRELRAEPSHPLLMSGSLHASLIEGGQELSSYPERCLVRIERRTVPGETPELVEAQVREVVERATLEDPDLCGTVMCGFGRPPFEVAEEESIVQLVRDRATAVLGRRPALVGHFAWMDSAILAAAGIPTVVFGPGGEGAHAAVEWVSLDDLERLVEILVGVAADFCA